MNVFRGTYVKKKQSIVESLVKSLKCKDSCGSCATCVAIAEKRYPDVVYLSVEGGDIKVGQIRDLIEQFQLGTWNSEWKIAVINQADKMNQEAQSAFLKLLEEPKGNTLFILLTEFPSLLFETIRSRAQELKLYHFDEVSIETRELLELQQKPFVDRFAAAKKLADKSENIKPTLDEWLNEARAKLLKEVEQKGEIAEWENIAQDIEKTKRVIEKTNVSARLALEQLLIRI